MKEHTHATPDRTAERKEFAPEYAEKTEEIDPEEITATVLKHHTTDFTYFTRKGTKTVRCVSGQTPANYNETAEGFISFYDDGTEYAYNPEEQRLITINRNGENRTIAQADDFYKFENVQYPERAPVEVAVDTDVEATIYYRSPQSDRMQTVTIEVSLLEGNLSAPEISGKEVGTGRRIKAQTRWEREIVSKHGTTERPLGKVARVEFPKGHAFTVQVEGLGDETADRAPDQIANKVQSAFRSKGVSVNVSHDGRLDWE
jgi:hypothetical protein